MTILCNGKKGVPKSYKDTARLLAEMGRFNRVGNVPVKKYRK